MQLLLYVGLAIYIVGTIWLILRGFGHGLLWGLALLFFSPIAAIVFAFLDWQSAKAPLITLLVGLITILFGGYLAYIGSQVAA